MGAHGNRNANATVAYAVRGHPATIYFPSDIAVRDTACMTEAVHRERPTIAVSTLEHPARTALWIAIALISYGSLYPMKFAVPETAAWHAFLTSWGGRSSLGDLLGNIALFAPCGFLGFLALGRERQTPTAVIIVMAVAIIYAALLQALQLFVPQRVPALIDVLWNALGTAFGIGLFLPLRNIAGAANDRTLALPVPLLLLILWALSELVPLVPSLDFEALQDSLKPLVLAPRWRLSDALVGVSTVLAVGHLLSLLMSYGKTFGWLALTLVAVALGKVLVLTQTLDVSVLTGWSLGVVVWIGLGRLPAAARAVTVFCALIITTTVAALEPFSLRAFPSTFDWMPFADVLSGSPLNNLRALFPRLFVYAMLLWLCQRERLRIATVGLGLWVAVLEGMQTQLVGRIATISEPIWLALVAVLVASLHRTSASTSSARPTDTTDAGAQPAPGARFHDALRVTFTGKQPILWSAATALVSIALLVWMLVRLPGVPYNVRELLAADGGIFACLMFACAILWWGAGSVVLAQRISHSRFPLIAIPLWSMAVSIISLWLMMFAVTDESIRDIAGSNNLYAFVTRRGIWGEAGKALFEALPGSAVVAFFERPIRYAAVVGPLLVLLALAHITRISAAADRVRIGWLLLAATPWLWLCQAINFGTSATDNLSELIATPDTLGIGGGAYLYGALALLAASSALAANLRTNRAGLAALTGIMLSLPLGWWLVNHGLEANVHKYGMTFSGLQFLLGPDRSHDLSTAALFARWSVVYLGAVVVFATGMRIAGSMLQPAAVAGQTTPATHKVRRATSNPAANNDAITVRLANGDAAVAAQTTAATHKARRATLNPAPNNDAITVRLAKNDIDFLNELAERTKNALPDVVARIIATALSNKAESDLLEALTTPRQSRQAGDVDALAGVAVILAPEQFERINGLADMAGVSVSRAVRRLVSAFIRDMQ